MHPTNFHLLMERERESIRIAVSLCVQKTGLHSIYTITIYWIIYCRIKKSTDCLIVTTLSCGNWLLDRSKIQSKHSWSWVKRGIHNAVVGMSIRPSKKLQCYFRICILRLCNGNVQSFLIISAICRYVKRMKCIQKKWNARRQCILFIIFHWQRQSA